jgi:hypothetical protein
MKGSSSDWGSDFYLTTWPHARGRRRAGSKCYSLDKTPRKRGTEETLATLTSIYKRYLDFTGRIYEALCVGPR